jgi:hypothetical protein
MTRICYLTCIAFLFNVLSLSAQSTSWKGTVSANWSVAGNWTNGVPDASKDVVIGDASFTGAFQPKVNAVGYCKSITIGASATISLTLTRHLYVSGDFTIATNGTVLHPGSTLFLTGNWVNNGSYSNSATAARVIFNGVAQSIGGSNITTFRTVTINAGSTVTLLNNVRMDSASSVLTVNGTINPGTAPGYKLSTTGVNKINGTGKLLIYGNTFADNFSFSGTTTFYAGATAEYAAMGDQVISSAYSYSTLLLSGSGTKSLTANLPLLYGKNAANGIIQVQNCTFDMGTFTANRQTNAAGGTLSVGNGATLRLSGTNNFPLNFNTRSLAANSLVAYYGADQTISGQTYGNLTITGGGTKTAASAVSVQGTFLLQNGTWSTGATTVTHSFAGDFNMTGGSISGTNATYQFNGTTNQSLSVLSSLPKVTLNKAGGSLLLQSDLTVTGTLSFTLGKIQTGTNYVIIPSTATITGAADNTGWVNGNMRMQFAGGSAVSKTLTIGTATAYNPATLAFASVTVAGNVTGYVNGSDHAEIAYSGIDDAKNVNVNWTLTNESVTFTTVDISFGWSAADLDAGANTAIFKTGLYNGSAWTLNTVSNLTATSIKATGLSSLGQFAAGERLFTATWNGNNLTANWFDPKNWHGGIPQSDMDVVIPSGISGGRLYPVVNTGTSVTKDITVEAGASLQVTGATIQIGGAIANDGTFDVSDATVELNGSAPQTIADGAFTGYKIKNLIISNDVSLNSVDSITGTLSIADGKTFNTNDNLTLRSTANGTARLAALPVDGSGNATAYINGSVNIERYIPARKAWRLLSVPIANGNDVTINDAWQEGASASSFGPSDPNPGYGVHITGGTLANGFDQSLTNSPSMKVYNTATGTFTGLPATPGTFAAIGNYTGYFVYIRGDRSIDPMQGNNAAVTPTTLRVRGTVKTGKQTFNVNATGFTVFGNPYPSAINFATLTRTNVKNTFYIWDPKLAGSQGLGGYVTASWNSGTNSYDFTTSVSPVSQYIPSGEAVLIESADGINPGTLEVNETDKTSLGSDDLFGRRTTASNQLSITLKENNNNEYNLIDAALVTFDARYSRSIEAADARKLPMEHTSVGISCEGKTLAIERRPLPEKSDRIQLQLDQLNPGEYVLSVQPTWSHPTIHTAFIVDRYANNQTPMELNAAGATDLTFTVTADASSKAADRFSIVFDAPVLQPFSFKRVNANASSNNVDVHWEVAHPEQVTGYRIERRLDPKQSFVSIRTESAGAKANSLQTSDLLPMNWNQADYRVVATLTNGQTVTSTERRVIRTILLGPAVTVMPNPVTTFTLQFQTTDVPVGPYKLKITNASGVVIDQETVRVNNQTSSTFRYSLPATMAPGVYEISLMGEGVTISSSFIKQ